MVERDTSDDAPKGKPPIFRLLAIALGIVSATIMAQHGFHISFNKDFMTLLDIVDDVAAGLLGPVAHYLIEPFFSWLRSFGWHIPHLQPHWRYAFILLWLMFASEARAFSAAGTSWLFRVFIWSRGAACAFIGGVLSGTVALTDFSIFDFALFAILLWALVGLTWDTVVGKRRGELTIGIWGFISIAAVGVLDFLIHRYIGISGRQGLGLAALAAITAGAGFAVIFLGAFLRPGLGNTWLKRWFNSRGWRMGIDILSALGGAAFIALIAHWLA